MLVFLCYIPIALSFLMLAAHFLRDGYLVPALACIVVPIFLIKTHDHVARRVLQGVLVIASLEWLRTLYLIIRDRNIEGTSWTASAIILISVALFTLVAGLTLELPPLRERFKRAERIGAEGADDCKSESAES